MAKNHDFFGKFAKKVSQICGSPWAFATATGAVIIWGITGPFFGYSETWQLVINTGTTIVTFLMVFIIQHTQNKDSAAVQIKLDELIRANPHAHNSLLDLEELSEEEIEQLRDYYEALAREAQKALRKGEKDKNKPEADNSLLKAVAGDTGADKTASGNVRRKAARKSAVKKTRGRKTK